MSNDTLSELLARGANGKAILFCGAGASLDSINFDLDELPAANPLLEKFNKHLGKNYSKLPIAASAVADRSIKDYFRIITDAFTVKSVSADMESIASFPWNRVYTTNYDDSIEKACDGIGKKTQPLTGKSKPKDILPGRLPVIHLHGFIKHFDMVNIRQECILDYNSNVANDVYSGPWATELKNDISTSDVIIFLGYSLYDPEIAKIILQGGISKNKIFFVNSKREDEELSYMQSQFGTSLNIEKDGFARIIESTPSGTTPNSKNYVCFRSSKEQMVDPRGITYQDVNDLFIFGKVDEKLLQTDIASQTSNYIIRPHLVDKIRTEISSGKTLISLHSPLGHGKTLLCKILSAELGKEMDVFLATRNQSEFLDELQDIVSNYNQPVVIIDDYYKFVRYQRQLSKYDSSDVIFIFTSRLGVHETRKEELPTIFLNHNVVDLRIGELNDADGSSLVPLINQAGMWGDLSKLSDTQKSERLLSQNKDGFQGNFADILVGLMNSSEMIGRVRKELTILKSMSLDAYNVVLLSIYLEFTNNHIDEFVIDQGLNVSLNEINGITEIENVFRVFFTPSSGAGNYFTGSLFAKYAMEKICDADDLLSVVEFASNRFADIRYISQEAKLVLIDLLRFNYLKVIAGKDRGRLKRIRELYSNLSANPNLNRDDLFWNAFGMCERQLENFDEAIRHFKTGISYSKTRNEHYISYHAQNQLIICLLERGLAMDLDADTAYRDAIEVSDLLRIQADDEREYGRGQAFKWHQELQEYLNKYFLVFGTAEKARVFLKYGQYVKFIRQSVSGWDRREHAAFMVKKLETFLRSNPIN